MIILLNLLAESGANAAAETPPNVVMFKWFVVVIVIVGVVRTILRCMNR